MLKSQKEFSRQITTAVVASISVVTPDVPGGNQVGHDAKNHRVEGKTEGSIHRFFPVLTARIVRLNK